MQFTKRLKADICLSAAVGLAIGLCLPLASTGHPGVTPHNLTKHIVTVFCILLITTGAWVAMRKAIGDFSHSYMVLAILIVILGAGIYPVIRDQYAFRNHRIREEIVAFLAKSPEAYGQCQVLMICTSDVGIAGMVSNEDDLTTLKNHLIESYGAARAERLLRSVQVASQLNVGGGLRIRDLTVDDVRSGTNWKVKDPKELSLVGEQIYLEDVHLETADSFTADDVIAYSAVYVTENGEVTPILLIKRVGRAEIGGDYCWLRDGKWQQLGLVPDPDAPHGTEYVAAPLDQDPSFDTMDNEKDDFRAENRTKFAEWARKLSGTNKNGR